MSEMTEVLRLLQELRREVREDFKEVKAKQDKTNGAVQRHDREITVLKIRDEDDREGKKRLKDYIPQFAGGVIILGLSVVLSTLVGH